jgi:hypothetical protein
MCGSVRGIVMVAGEAAGRGVEFAAASGGGGGPAEAMFFKRSRSFWDINSKTERGADGKGVSPSKVPRYCP